MKPSTRSVRTTACIISAIIFGLTGCASLRIAPEQALQARVAGLADAKIAGDWAKAYDFFASRFKAEVKKEMFLKSNKIIFKSYKITEFDMAASQDSAKVTVTYDAIVNGYDLSGMADRQHWIKENGKWVLDIKPTSGFID